VVSFAFGRVIIAKILPIAGEMLMKEEKAG